MKQKLNVNRIWLTYLACQCLIATVHSLNTISGRHGQHRPPFHFYNGFSIHLRPPDFEHRPVIGRPPPPPNSEYWTTESTTTTPWYWAQKTTPRQVPATVLPVPRPVHVYVSADEQFQLTTPRPSTEPSSLEPTPLTPSTPETTTKSPVWQQTTSTATTESTTKTTTHTTTRWDYFSTTPNTPSSPEGNYILPDGTFYNEYIESNGYPRIEQGYFQTKNGRRIFVKRGSYVVKNPDNTLHRITWVADENGYRTRDQVIAG